MDTTPAGSGSSATERKTGSPDAGKENHAPAHAQAQIQPVSAGADTPMVDRPLEDTAHEEVLADDDKGYLSDASMDISSEGEADGDAQATLGHRFGDTVEVLTDTDDSSIVQDPEDESSSLVTQLETQVPEQKEELGSPSSSPERSHKRTKTDLEGAYTKPSAPTKTRVPSLVHTSDSVPTSFSNLLSAARRPPQPPPAHARHTVHGAPPVSAVATAPNYAPPQIHGPKALNLHKSKPPGKPTPPNAYVLQKPQEDLPTHKAAVAKAASEARGKTVKATPHAKKSPQLTPTSNSTPDVETPSGEPRFPTPSEMRKNGPPYPRPATPPPGIEVLPLGCMPHPSDPSHYFPDGTCVRGYDAEKVLDYVKQNVEYYPYDWRLGTPSREEQVQPWAVDIWKEKQARKQARREAEERGEKPQPLKQMPRLILPALPTSNVAGVTLAAQSEHTGVKRTRKGQTKDVQAGDTPIPSVELDEAPARQTIPLPAKPPLSGTDEGSQKMPSQGTQQLPSQGSSNVSTQGNQQSKATGKAKVHGPVPKNGSFVHFNEFAAKDRHQVGAQQTGIGTGTLPQPRGAAESYTRSVTGTVHGIPGARPSSAGPTPAEYPIESVFSTANFRSGAHIAANLQQLMSNPVYAPHITYYLTSIGWTAPGQPVVPGLRHASVGSGGGPNMQTTANVQSVTNSQTQPSSANSDTMRLNALLIALTRVLQQHGAAVPPTQLPQARISPEAASQFGPPLYHVHHHYHLGQGAIGPDLVRHMEEAAESANPGSNQPFGASNADGYPTNNNAEENNPDADEDKED